MVQKSSLVSADELEALLSGVGTERAASVDVYFPLRSFFLLLLVGSWIIRLLFFTDSLAAQLTQSAEAAARLTPYLYFRGWFLVLILSVAFYAYHNNWYPALVYGGFFFSAAVNFLFDGFTVYTQVLSYPAPLSTFFLMLRFFAMYMVFQHFRNAGRIPPKHDRWNLLLPWKKPADSPAP